MYRKVIQISVTIYLYLSIDILFQILFYYGLLWDIE